MVVVGGRAAGCGDVGCCGIEKTVATFNDGATCSKRKVLND